MQTSDLYLFLPSPLVSKTGMIITRHMGVNYKQCSGHPFPPSELDRCSNEAFFFRTKSLRSVALGCEMNRAKLYGGHTFLHLRFFRLLRFLIILWVLQFSS
jgi:hypothetical protein